MELPDGCPDEPAPEAEAPDPRPADAYRSATAAWDASGDVPQAAPTDAEVHPAPADEAAEKLVAPAPAARAPDAWFPPLERRLAQPEALVWAVELCTPVAAQFAAQSCAAMASAGPQAQPDEVRSPQQAEPGTQLLEKAPTRPVLPRAQPFARAAL
jgi:hypothetical protein